MNTAPPSRIFDCMHIDAVGVLDLKDYKIFFRKNTVYYKKPHAQLYMIRA